MSANPKLATVLLIAGAALFLGATAADAQKATNLKCNGCVGTKDIADKAVKPKKLHRSAKPTAGENAFTDGFVQIDHPNVVTAQSETVTLPSKGNLIAIASWRWILDANEGSECTITLDSEEFSSAFRIRGANLTGESDQIPGSTTGMFPEVAAGDHTVRLLCKADSGDDVSVQLPNLTTLFVPGLL